MIYRNLSPQRNISLILGLAVAACGLLSAPSASALGLSSSGLLSFKGSVISCITGQNQGTVTAFPGNAALGTPATYTEHSDNVICTYYNDPDGNGIPGEDASDPPLESGHFALDVTYTLEGLCIVQDANSGVGQEFQACGTKTDTQNPKHSGGSTSSNTSQAQCDPTTGTLLYQAFCGPNVTVEGTLKWVGAPGEPNPPTFTGCASGVTPDECVMKLGDFVRNRKGQVDLSMCPYEFPDQTTAGGTLAAGEILRYTETYNSDTCQGAPDTAGPGFRRMCDNHSFDPNSTNGPCAPEKVSGSTYVFYSGGINPHDAMSVDAQLLYDGQWQPNSTLNVGCQNSGNVPTTIVDSATFNTNNIGFVSAQTPVAYVKGIPTDTSPVISISNNTGGKTLNFDGCRDANNGLMQVICRHKDAWTKDSSGADQIVLSIEGANTSGLGFIGNSTPVKLVGTCAQ